LIGTQRNGFRWHYELAPSNKRGVRKFRPFGSWGTEAVPFLIIYRA
jgi:hypothetical protein